MSYLPVLPTPNLGFGRSLLQTTSLVTQRVGQGLLLAAPLAGCASEGTSGFVEALSYVGIAGTAALVGALVIRRIFNPSQTRFTPEAIQGKITDELRERYTALADGSRSGLVTKLTADIYKSWETSKSGLEKAEAGRQPLIPERFLEERVQNLFAGLEKAGQSNPGMATLLEEIRGSDQQTRAIRWAKAQAAAGEDALRTRIRDRWQAFQEASFEKLLGLATREVSQAWKKPGAMPEKFVEERVESFLAKLEAGGSANPGMLELVRKIRESDQKRATEHAEETLFVAGWKRDLDNAQRTRDALAAEIQDLEGQQDTQHAIAARRRALAAQVKTIANLNARIQNPRAAIQKERSRR